MYICIYVYLPACLSIQSNTIHSFLLKNKSLRQIIGANTIRHNQKLLRVKQ